MYKSNELRICDREQLRLHEQIIIIALLHCHVPACMYSLARSAKSDAKCSTYDNIPPFE